MMIDDDTLKVKKGALEDCLTCPLCFNLLKEATTICSCHHTFCRECIYQKFEDDRTNCCPMCNVFLGSCPEEKLRPDNNLQDLRLKIFPLKKSRDLKNTMTSTRKKEISLSSLDIAPTTRKSSRTRAQVVSGTPVMSKETTRRLENEKEMIQEKSHLGPTSSLERSTKLPIVYKKQRISSQQEPSQVADTMVGPSKNLETSSNGKDKHVNWEGLSVLAETANRRDGLRVPLLGLPAFNLENNDKLNMKSPQNMKRRAREPKSEKINNIVDLNKSFVPEETPQPSSNGDIEVIDLTGPEVAVPAANVFADKPLRRLYPVWFTLLACQDKNPYPQVPKSYIRIKDGDLPVSYVNKYLVKKLNLRHESEVEVMCCGQELAPSATLNSLAEMWVQFASNSDAMICRSNSDVHNFVMVLTYRRK